RPSGPGDDVRGPARAELSRVDGANGAWGEDRAARGRVPPRPHVHALVLAARARRGDAPDRARHRRRRAAPAALVASFEDAGGLADLDQMPVRIAQVAADLAAVVDG